MAATAQVLPYRDASLSPEQRADDLISRLTLEEKVSLMMDQSPAIERLEIPEFPWWSEALHGVARSATATVLPQAIGMAATWDPAFVEDAFTMVSDEGRAIFNDFRKKGDMRRYHGLSFWTPNVNIFRDPRWGRGQETYGEDPYLTTQLGLSAVRGLQGNDPKFYKTIACAKHFAVHSGPEWNRHTFDAKDIDAVDLWETYLPQFKALVDEGVGQVMCAYNRYEGEPCCANTRLLHKILRGEWGYDNIIVTDCWAMRDFVVDWGHNTHPGNEPQASADAVNTGVDLECGPMFKNLVKAVNEGLITEEHINAALKKLLVGRYRLGEIFPDETTPWDAYGPEHVDTKEHRDLALRMARESMTLLKNNGILPLKKDARVLVVGPNAADSVMLWGNYSGKPSRSVTILDGIKNLSKGRVDYVRGCDWVVSSDLASAFNLFDGGMKAEYYNNVAGEGDPVATDVYTTPINKTTGGAIVFAPNVSLTDFSGRLTGKFVPDEDGFYTITLEAGKDGEQRVSVDGEQVVFREKGGRNDHKASYLFEGKKGVPVEIGLFFNNGKEQTTVRFDVMKQVDNTVDASAADVVVFVGGISPQLEGEEMKVSVPGFRGGDRETIELPAVQRQLVAKLKAQGKKVVFVNCSGSAMGLTPENEICDAILQAWYPGEEGGTAVAEVLYGDYNPAGRLPITFYKDDSQLPDFLDYSMEGRTYRYFRGEPLYAFGHGLSYTTFDYSKGRLDKKSYRVGEPVKLTFELKNTGARDGDEVAQVYVRRLDDPAAPLKSLKAFRRVATKAGEAQTVEFELPASAFESFDRESQRMALLPGRFEVLYGPSSSSLSTPLPLTIK